MFLKLYGVSEGQVFTAGVRCRPTPLPGDSKQRFRLCATFPPSPAVRSSSRAPQHRKTYPTIPYTLMKGALPAPSGKFGHHSPKPQYLTVSNRYASYPPLFPAPVYKMRATVAAVALVAIILAPQAQAILLPKCPSGKGLAKKGGNPLGVAKPGECRSCEDKKCHDWLVNNSDTPCAAPMDWIRSSDWSPAPDLPRLRPSLTSPSAAPPPSAPSHSPALSLPFPQP
jgi:hypothetical protein